MQDLNYYLQHLTTNFNECSCYCHFLVARVFSCCTVFVIIGIADKFILVTYFTVITIWMGCVVSILYFSL